MQFRLRTLAVFVATIAVIAKWWNSDTRRNEWLRQQIEVVQPDAVGLDWNREEAGISIEGEVDALTRFQQGRWKESFTRDSEVSIVRREGERWRALLGRSYFETPVSVRFRGVQVPSSLLNAMVHSPVRKMSFESCDLTDEDVRVLVKAEQLVSLELINNPRITDRSLQNIGDLSKLQWLTITGCSVTGSFFAAKKLNSLIWLDLSNTDICGDGLQHISRSCPYLRGLRLNSTDITDSDLASLLRSRRLESFQGKYTNLTDNCFRHLIEVRRLRHLDLQDFSGSRVTKFGTIRYLMDRCDRGDISLESVIFAARAWFPSLQTDAFSPVKASIQFRDCGELRSTIDGIMKDENIAR